MRTQDTRTAVRAGKGVLVTNFLTNIHIHVFLLLGAVYFLLLSISNILWLRLSSRRPKIFSGDKVSVLVPARDEEQNIARCLESLVDQSYKNYEIIVLDDQSSDHTWRIITEFERKYPGLVRAVKGKNLPGEGWTGKANAMQQLSGYATGDYFLFTDADTVHGRDSVAWAVTNTERHRVDFVSGFVRQDLQSFGEQFIVPATYIMTALILPLWLIPNTKASWLSFAIGQLIIFKRKAFESIGGYSSISGHISDDIFIARELKRAGFRTIFLDISRYVTCRMYEGYAASVKGMSKNIYDYFKNKPVFFAVALTVLVLFALFPLYLLVLRVLTGGTPIQHTELSVLAFALAWSLTLYDRGLQWWVPLLYPLLFLNLLYMAWRSFGKAAAGKGVVWKGRTIR